MWPSAAEDGKGKGDDVVRLGEQGVAVDRVYALCDSEA